MKTFKNTIMIAALAFAGVSSVHATVAPVAGNTVLVGCTAPSQTGATVYSIDSAIQNGSGVDSLTLPTSVVTGAACGVALNALNSVTCATGKTWVANPLVNVTISGSGYSLQQFQFTCQ